MQETIGGVTLDYSQYSGTDHYSDGSVEDTLLHLVQTHTQAEFDSLILAEKDWAILYHLSQVRGNLVRFLPLSKQDHVLEIGAGCGAVTGTLAELSKSVTCVELSKKRSLINAYRNRELENINIKVGNFQNIEKTLTERYSCITLIGVLEYAESYLQSEENAYLCFLRTIRKHLADNGLLVLAIENKFGLKYWAGCKEDHTGAYFEGLEGYPHRQGVKTFSKQELRRLCQESGFSSCDFYYPYPDYKLPSKIYSDHHLPKRGELTDNRRNFDNERLCLFDESKVFDELIDSGMFPFFSNSFLLLLRA